MKKNIITNIIKFSLAIGLLYWLIQSGKLDFTLLKELMLTPFVMIFAIFLLLVNHALVTYRLRFIILKKATQGLSFIKLFMANWIGIFFNSVVQKINLTYSGGSSIVFNKALNAELDNM